MDMDDSFIPTSWLTLIITNKTRHIADDGTLDVAITGQRGAHLIELFPEDNTAPWGTMEDDLYSKIQLPCQVEVKGRLSINAGEERGGIFKLVIVVEKWRIVKSPPKEFLVSEDNEVKCDGCNNKSSRQGETMPLKRLTGSASMSESNHKRFKSVQPSSNHEHFYSPRGVVSVPSCQQPLPTTSVFQSPETVLPSYLPHQSFSDGRRRIVRIAINAQAEEESVDAMVVYEDWR
ncbi:hypothetical protein BGZ90_000198 [Linnemannia elongata]|nr:hypothetical protein BGZ90_000198 [Linnemannia elongata]